MRNFKEFMNEGIDDLAKLQIAWNKYRFNTDADNDAQAEKFLRQATSLYKKVIKRDKDATTASGISWSKTVKGIINEDVIVEGVSYDSSWHKGIKTTWQKEIVDEIMNDSETLSMSKEMDLDLSDKDDAKKVITNILTSIKKKKRGDVYEISTDMKIGKKSFKKTIKIPLDKINEDEVTEKMRVNVDAIIDELKNLDEAQLTKVFAFVLQLQD